MLDMRHIKITNHSLWCQATNSQASNNHSMLGSSVKPTSRQCYLSIVSQFKAMACMEPYFHVNHEILTLGFQKPKPVTILSKRSHQIFFFFYIWKGLLSRFSLVRLCVTPQTIPPRPPHPWDSPKARILEWVAISFSSAWKWKVKVKSLSCVRLPETPWTAAHQAPPSMGFSRQEYWSGVPLPSPWKGLGDVNSNS